MAKALTRTIIERARELIADESHWCRGTLAKNAQGRYVCPSNPSAVRYCAVGALIAAAYEIAGASDDAQALAYRAEKLIPSDTSLVAVNDGAGHAAVLQLFDAALAAS